MSNAPRIDNAPGLAWQELKTGWQASWRVRSDIKKKGFRPKYVRLWTATPEQLEPSKIAVKMIQDSCQRYQDAMLAWGRRNDVDEIEKTPFDGTWKSLVNAYQTDKDSRFKKARYRSRVYYAALCRRIERDHGDERLEDFRGRHSMRWYEAWCAGADGTPMQHVSRGHSLIKHVRTMVSFGASILEDEQCERIAGLMHRMKFENGKARVERLTAEQAIAIRKQAHAMGYPSIALAQALQFELTLRQRDVIGEWVPMSEPGLSLVTYGNEKWLRGLRWEEIDEDMILRHVTSKRLKELVVDLKLAPMVMEEIAMLGPRPASGPIVVAETGRPWLADHFRKVWRKLATAAGIPKTVKNMDSRAGAISEATDAGADLESVRHAATHSDVRMTQRYSRDAGGRKVADVMKLRVGSRKHTTNSNDT